MKAEIAGTGNVDSGWITAKEPDRIEVVLKGHTVAVIRSAVTDSEMSWLVVVDKPGQYIVIKVDTP